MRNNHIMEVIALLQNLESEFIQSYDFNPQEFMSYVRACMLNQFNTIVSWRSFEEDSERSIVIFSPHIVDKESVCPCNGLVMEYVPQHYDIPWHILAYPPKALAHNIPADLKKNFYEYTVYEAHDGTTITMYYFDDEWKYATARGYDVKNMPWWNDVTYGEVLAEVFEHYPDFSFDRLSPGTSYTIGFTHHKFHPFEAGKICAWFIEARNPEEDCSVVDADIGIPPQKPIDIAYSEMRNNAAGAFDNFVKNKTINYGYCLRHKQKPDLFLESTLMREIRRLVYNKKNMQFADSPFYEEVFICFRAMLNRETAEIYKKLFPRHEKIWKDFCTAFDHVCDQVVYRFITQDCYALETVDRNAVYFYRCLSKNITTTGQRRAKWRNENSAEHAELRANIVNFLMNPLFVNRFYSIYLEYILGNPPRWQTSSEPTMIQ